MKLILEAIKSMLRKMDASILSVKNSFPTKLTEFENDLINIDLITPITIDVTYDCKTNTASCDYTNRQIIDFIKNGFSIRVRVSGKFYATIDKKGVVSVENLEFYMCDYIENDQVTWYALYKTTSTALVFITMTAHRRNSKLVFSCKYITMA